MFPARVSGTLDGLLVLNGLDLPGRRKLLDMDSMSQSNRRRFGEGALTDWLWRPRLGGAVMSSSSEKVQISSSLCTETLGLELNLDVWAGPNPPDLATVVAGFGEKGLVVFGGGDGEPRAEDESSEMTSGIAGFFVLLFSCTWETHLLTFVPVAMATVPWSRRRCKHG
jgi:hypothetical protein